MKSWGHGHSMGAGLIVGLSLAAHAWLFVVGGLVLGFVAGFIVHDLATIRRYFVNRFARRVVVHDEYRRRW